MRIASCGGLAAYFPMAPTMPTSGNFPRLLRASLEWSRIESERVADSLKSRASLIACASLIASGGALALPSLAPVVLTGLLAMVVWAGSVPVSGSYSESGIDPGGRGGTPSHPNPQRNASISSSVVQALGDPALTLNRRFEVVEANAAAEDVFGDVRVGQHISHTTRNPEMTAAVADAIRLSQRKTFAFELRTPLERHLEGVAAPLDMLQSGNEQAAAVLVYLRDLTEQDRLAAMRADFVANASHELRTPLASLKGFIETMQGAARSDTAAQGRFLEIMSQQAERMTRLIDDLLSLSRIEMRAHIPPNASVNLNEIATSVVAALEPQVKIAGAVVTVHPLARPAMVRGDHDELVQAVQNLVQNAIKYGGSPGKIDVRIGSEDKSRCSISVTDDGPGIAPEHLPRLTERFYRVNVASSRDRGGTGLGLAIVKHIVTRHRGVLTITSTAGQGSTFKVALPAL